MAFTRGDFKASVFESLENDQRFSVLLNEACSRGVDEVYAHSDFGNFRYEVQGGSVNRQEEYDLPPETFFVNFVTYRGIKLDRFTMDEWLNRKSLLNSAGVSGSLGPDSFLVKDNRALILSFPPSEQGKEIVAYLTLADDGFTDATDTADMPIARRYTRGAWHHARAFLLHSDGQEERAASEEKLAEKYIAKDSRLLKGSVKTKVKRVV